MWDLPGPGLEPVSPALAGGFSTTVPPGKYDIWFFFAFLERKEEEQQGSVLAQLPCAQPASGQYSVLAEESVTPGCCSASQIFFRIFLPTPIALASLRASGERKHEQHCAEGW